MRALIINITTPNDPAANKDFTLKVLKDAAYNSKIKNPMNRSMNYEYVFVPMIEVDEKTKITPKYQNEINRYLNLLPRTLFGNQQINRDAYYSIGKFLEKNADYGKEDTYIEYLLKYRFYIDVVTEITEDEFAISYTDGSFNKGTNAGGYCCLKVEKTNNINNPMLLETVTQKRRNFTEFSGSLEQATNNSAELTAIKEAIQNASKERFQLIISDCDYGMKSFRDYIYNWRLNGWKASNNKPIKNLELIQEINDYLCNSGKIFLFQWTESHVGNPFNEMCDTIAKNNSGIL